MRIEFADGSLAAHPCFERYMDESTTAGAVPLRFECTASSNLSAEEVAELAAEHFERREKEADAEILPATVVATWTQIDDAPAAAQQRTLTRSGGSGFAGPERDPRGRGGLAESAPRLDVEPSAHRRYRVLAIARLRKPEVDRVVVRIEADP